MQFGLRIYMQKIIYRHKGKFEFEAGGSIDGLQLTYHTSPYPYRKGMKVVWICHALTANSDAQDWWPELVGPGRLFDTEKYTVEDKGTRKVHYTNKDVIEEAILDTFPNMYAPPTGTSKRGTVGGQVLSQSDEAMYHEPSHKLKT